MKREKESREGGQSQNRLRATELLRPTLPLGNRSSSHAYAGSLAPFFEAEGPHFHQKPFVQFHLCQRQADDWHRVLCMI